MASDPNKRSNFWQELKRGKVIHVVTFYATAAFVILQLFSTDLYLRINVATLGYE